MVRLPGGVEKAVAFLFRTYSYLSRNSNISVAIESSILSDLLQSDHS